MEYISSDRNNLSVKMTKTGFQRSPFPFQFYLFLPSKSRDLQSTLSLSSANVKGMSTLKRVNMQTAKP